MEFFIESLGKLFQQGVDMDISKLYPPIQFPVSRNTPMISPNIKWNHTENHFVPHFDSYNTFERRNIIINISDRKFEFIQGHLIDGRCLFPATGWIFLIWETFSMMIGMNFEKVKVVFEDIQFLRATALNKNQDVLITISIHRGTGRFEVIEGVSAVVHGYIRQEEEIEMSEITVLSDENTLTLGADDFYKEMRLHGFCHLGEFQGIKEIRHDGLKGKIKWAFNWITFIDSMTHFEELETNARTLALPTNIRKVVIDPILHYQIMERKQKELEGVEDDKKEILYDVKISPYLKIIQAGGVEIHDKINRVVNRRRPKEPTLESQKFIPFFANEKFSLKDAAKIITQTALETIFQPRFCCIEIDSDSEPLSEFLSKAVQAIPMVQSDVTFLTSKENIELENVSISSDSELSSFNGVDLIIKSNCVKDNEFLDSIKSVLNSNGYILSREQSTVSEIDEKLQLVAKVSLENGEVLHMLQLKDNIKPFEPQNIIEITSNLLLNHTINVYKNQSWGGYRFLDFKPDTKPISTNQHCFANCLIKGDLSSLAWMRGPIDVHKNEIIRIHFRH
ncbi:hypothetical protein PVAND_013485 [Polypedilum vanderplanki]|uniref:PKS/mFAS DH domain-containing protein n=1 Tax=Polypedilum vanderplanki TaxID=319348 RepID=A0A9J6CQM2_POLVA|nr:hypothetical protein PVAND_013485 [Polypedilum vanderplanki]